MRPTALVLALASLLPAFLGAATPRPPNIVIFLAEREGLQTALAA